MHCRSMHSLSNVRFLDLYLLGCARRCARRMNIDRALGILGGGVSDGKLGARALIRSAKDVLGETISHALSEISFSSTVCDGHVEL